MKLEHRWQPLEPLTAGEESINLGMQSLIDAWKLTALRLQETSPQSLQRFNERLVRRLSVETGIIERLYDVDRGTTEQLVEHGFREGLIPRDSTNVDPTHLATVLSDHESAWTLVQQCVDGDRELTIGLIHELHHAYTAHQPAVTAYDRDGRMYDTPLLRGAFKQQPNTVTLQSGVIHEYCPPLQVAPEMDRLLALLAEYQDKDPILVAAWFHHRFVQIHPYQDGNGRVARALTGLVLLRAGLLPIVVDRDARTEYLDALETADAGDLTAFAKLFARLEEGVISQALSLREQTENGNGGSATDAAIGAIEAKLQNLEDARMNDLSRVNYLARVLRDDANKAFQTQLSRLVEIIEGGTLPYTSIKHDAVLRETDFIPPNLYSQGIVDSARQRDIYVELSHSRLIAERVLTLRREALFDQLVLSVSLHSVGRHQHGVMEALAFYCIEAVRSAYEPHVSRRNPILCSQRPFILTYNSFLDDLQDRFALWLDQAIAVAVEAFGDRI